MKTLSLDSRRLLVLQSCPRASSVALVRPPLVPRREFAARCRLLEARPTTNGLGRQDVARVKDDGRTRWRELSRGEKAARVVGATKQSFNFLVVIAGLVATVAQPAGHRETSSTNWSRERLRQSYTLKCFLRIARLGNSIALLRESRPTLDARNCLVLRIRSAHTESHPGADGREIAASRKQPFKAPTYQANTCS